MTTHTPPDKPFGGMTNEIVTNQAGAKQSKLAQRFDLVPPIAIACVSEVLAEGVEKYPDINGVCNWRLIPSTDHINHAIAHLYLHLSGDCSEAHLDHATARLMFALEMHKSKNYRVNA
jgi:hypothetical protein